MKDDQETKEKIEKAVELLKEAGLEDFVVIGRGYGTKYSLFEVRDDAGFDDVSELQGYIQQSQHYLSSAALEDSNTEEDAKQTNAKDGDI